MPQPLSKILDTTKEWSINFNPDCMEKNSELGGLIADIIARWSAIEHRLAHIMIMLLGSNPVPAYAIFSTLINSSTQFDAVDRVAKSELSEENYERFAASLSVVKTMAKARNKLAHWIWATSPQVPEALLLGRPVKLLEKAVRIQMFQSEFVVKSPESKAKYPKDLYHADLENIFVYRKADLEQIKNDLKQTAEILGCLLIGLKPSIIEPDLLAVLPPEFRKWFSSDEIFRRLSNLSLFAEALSRLRERQKNNPQAQAE